MNALIEIAGKQFKVEEGSSIKVPRLKGKIGSIYSIDKILYLENKDKKFIGKPYVEGQKLDAKIISHDRGRKVVVFKFKRRKGYQKKNTHREEYTVLEFSKINSSSTKKVVKKTATKKVVKKVATKKAPIKSETKKTPDKK